MRTSLGVVGALDFAAAFMGRFKKTPKQYPLFLEETEVSKCTSVLHTILIYPALARHAGGEPPK